MSEITLYGTFPSGPYADQETADLVKEARRKALAKHDMTMHGHIPICQTCSAMEDSLTRPCPKGHKNMSTEGIMARYPALVAHIIAESLGYACPSTAAVILRDAIQKKENWCEWIVSCYACDPRAMLRKCIKSRHYHTGYMAEYRRALALVLRAICDGKEPEFAAWF